MRKLAPIYFVLASLGLAVAFFLALGFHSYVPYDPGFLLAYSWRFMGGQVPYVDFLHLRPPFSLYLHAGWLLLPETWAFPASRLGYFIQMALAASLPAAAAVRVGLVADRPRALFLTLAFYAFALGNFPVMPWYTVDGVFFSSVALACWLQSTARYAPNETTKSGREARRSRRLLWRSLCSLALAAATLCKQPFSLLAVAFFVCVTVEFVRSSRNPSLPEEEGQSNLTSGHGDGALLAASLLPGLGLALMQLGVLAAQGAVWDFFDQVLLTPLQMPPKASGWANYFAGPVFAVLPGLVWPWLQRLARLDRRFVIAMPAIEFLALSGVVYMLPATQLNFVLLSFLVGQVVGRLLGLGLDADATGVARREERIRAGLGAWVALTAFATSLSWGASNPGLGLAALGIALTGQVGLRPGFRSGRFFAALLVLLAVVWSVQLRLRAPYLMLPVEQQTEPLHEIFPRFGRLWGTPYLYAQMSELRRLLERHAVEPERTFTVLRSFPLIHYLTNTQSPVALDWYYWVEMRGHEQKLTQELRALDGLVIIERSPWGQPPPESQIVRPCEEAEFSNSPFFLQHLYRKSKLIESGRYFCLLENQPKPPAAPRTLLPPND